LFIYFGNTGVCTESQGLELGRQELYQLSHTPALFSLFDFFETKFHYVAQACFEVTPSALVPECWAYRYESLLPTVFIFIKAPSTGDR
jgi:hypothetical protein